MNIKSFLILLCILALAPVCNAAQESYLNVTAPGNRLLKLAVTSPVAIAGTPNPAVAGELVDIFRFDMSLAGLFDVQIIPAAPMMEGIASGTFDFAPWKLAGYDLLLKTGYVISDSTIVVECHLYDLTKGAELTAKRFTGLPKELRRMAHLFSDEIMGAITGVAGPFSGKIAFVSKATGNKEIYLMDYDGANVKMLTANRSINLDPVFSPSDKEIVYTSYKGGNPDLYRKELYSGAESRISSRRGLNIGGAWAPDGNRIALAISEYGSPQICVIDKDGRLLERLTHDDDIDISPSWSPDGRFITFSSTLSGNEGIYVMRADGTGQARMSRWKWADSQPDWTRW